MNTIQYNLSHAYRLFSLILLIRGVFPVVKNHLIYLFHIRRGSRVSRLFRHLFELKYIKAFLGSNIAALVLASSFLPASEAASQMLEFDQAEEQIISQQIVELKTEKSIQYPTEEMNLTQRYSWYHRGLDIDGITGDPIKPIAPGLVSVVEFSKFGYGNSVIIDHGDGLSSLYAHMSKVFVEPNQKVNLNTVLGEMGSTGRSTGDHLHLEVRSGVTQINPLSVLH